MKTNYLTIALLAFSIQVTVNGQTSGSQSQRILPALGEKTNNVQKQKPMPQLISSEQNEISTQPKKTANILLTYSGNLPAAVFTREYAEKLLNESETLFEAGQIIRNDCGKEKEKQPVCESYIILHQQARMKHVVALEIQGKVNYDQYTININLINSLLSKLESAGEVFQSSTAQKNQSVHLMKLAREMREEAYSLENLAAIIGTLSNAEEKEKLSLDTQFKTIVTLKKAVAFYISFRDEALAFR